MKASQGPIAKLGIYSPTTPEAPLKAFTAALKEITNVSSSLLVLPEAFNIGTNYSRQCEIQKDPKILYELQELCCAFDISIVAGLIISAPTDQGTYPLSSAFLIDAHGARLLSHKMLSDNQGPYTTCLSGCDGHNATAYRNIAICSLICMDAYLVPTSAERQKYLKDKMCEVQSVQHRIVCIPAYIEATPAKFWGVPGGYRAVANAASTAKFLHSPGSFVEKLDQHGQAQRLEPTEKSSSIDLYHLPQTLHGDFPPRS